MSFVVLVFGASGSGKSTLLEGLMSKGRQYSIHIKETSRIRRQYDGIEIECVATFLNDNYDYVYQTYGAKYGIQRSQINEALSGNRHHFIICNDIPTIRSLKRDYGKAVRLVFLYFDAPRQVLEEIQQRRNISDDEINIRLAKIDTLYRTFVEEWNLFDGAICNRYGADPLDTARQMERLLEDFARAADVDGSTPNFDTLLDRLETQIASGRSGLGQARIPNYAFLLMAMSRDPHLEDTHHTVLRVCQDLGVQAERVDDIDYSGEITEKVLGSIKVASLIIADLTHERPNVYYEIGYADALGKPLLLLAREGTKLHFDLQGRRVEFYRNQTELEGILCRFVPALMLPEEPEYGA